MEPRFNSNTCDVLHPGTRLEPGDFACWHLTPPAVLSNVFAITCRAKRVRLMRSFGTLAPTP